MASTISINTKTISLILSRLDQLARDVNAIKSKVITEPLYGSDEWWKKADKKAIKSLDQGKGIVIHNKKELNSLFDNL